MSIYAIGDVQGCFTALQDLCLKIQFDPHRDTLWFSGDLINRGAQSLEVLRFVKGLGSSAVTVLGNHDLHFLAVANNAIELRPKDTLGEVLAAPDLMELRNWLQAQPLLYHAEGFTLVHAGLAPQWDLQQAQGLAKEVEQLLQSPTQAVTFFKKMYGDTPTRWQDNLSGWKRYRLISNYFTRMRFCDVQGNLDLNIKGAISPHDAYIPWFKVPNRRSKDLRILFGHWASLNGIVDEPRVYGLDTGCVWGKCLTALRLEDLQRFSVSCAKPKV
jgi:bis(5'-nucleosyl)-tetraphosphatase (symmetrical)